jgi:hypothetical protein
VQDVLQEQLAEPVYRALKEQGGHIYVCGDVTMAADVLKAIQRIMTQQGKLSEEDAGLFISRLRVSDRPASQTSLWHQVSCPFFLTPPASLIKGAMMISLQLGLDVSGLWVHTVNMAAICRVCEINKWVDL